MAIGKEIEKRSHIVGFKEEILGAAQQNKDAFFTWFNEAKNADASFVRGQWDFMYHIALPLSRYIKNPEELYALEIGYGGGRILGAASRGFKKVIGIDIHENAKLVEQEFRKKSIDNFELRNTDGQSIPLADNEVDVVYSFIVLQHVEKISIFIKYLQETFRVLKPGGVGVVYFGRKRFFPGHYKVRLLYWLDCFLEGVAMNKGYKEIPNKVNCTNLFVNFNYAKKVAKNCGFKILKKVVSKRQVPDGVNIYGGQHGIVMRKPETCSFGNRL